MTPAPLPPMSPLDKSPGSLPPSRPTSPPSQMSPSHQIVSQRLMSPPPASPPRKRSPSPIAQRPPSPLDQAPPSSPSASSSSDSGSDSASDSSDDSDDERVRPPDKGPSTPPSVSPRDNVEEPSPAIQETTKPRWNLGSFIKPATQPHGDHNDEAKPTQVCLVDRRVFGVGIRLLMLSIFFTGWSEKRRFLECGIRCKSNTK